MSTSPPRARRRRWPLLLSAVSALGFAGCSGSDAAGPTTSDPTVVVTAPTTTGTTPTTTTTEPADPTTSETTLEDVEAAIRTVHTRFMTELFARDEREVGPEAILVLAEELTTGRVLARTRDSAEERVKTGERVVSEGFDSNIVRVEITADSAVVLDCSQDRGQRYAATGDLLENSPSNFEFTETWLVYESGAWLVEEFLVGGDLPCEPPAA